MVLSADVNMTDALTILGDGNRTGDNSSGAEANILFNASLGSYYTYMYIDWTKSTYHMTRSFTVAVSFVGLLFNAMVFNATWRISPRTLKSKPLILNALVWDMAWDFSAALVMLGYVVEAYGATRPVYVLTRIINNYLMMYSLYMQGLASFLLSCDRMYAVVAPMTYHTIGYSTIGKILVLASSWLAAFVLLLPGLIIPYTDDRFVGRPVHESLSYGLRQYVYISQPYIAISANALVFIVYILIFIIFILQKKRNLAVDKSNEKTGKTLSLTLTYFFTHISSLCLYLPSPFVYMSRRSLITAISRNGFEILNQFLLMVYYCNTIINPIILATRVRLIRQHLEEILKIKNPKTARGPVETKFTSTNSLVRSNAA